MHWESGTVYAEPGADAGALAADGWFAHFDDLNVFFGGAQAVRDPASGALAGAGDPRRGGAVVRA